MCECFGVGRRVSVARVGGEEPLFSLSGVCVAAFVLPKNVASVLYMRGVMQGCAEGRGDVRNREMFAVVAAGPARVGGPRSGSE